MLIYDVIKELRDDILRGNLLLEQIRSSVLIDSREMVHMAHRIEVLEYRLGILPEGKASDAAPPFSARTETDF